MYTGGTVKPPYYPLMRSLLALTFLATQAQAWEFTPAPICTLSHAEEGTEVRVTYDHATRLYAIALTTAQGWPAAPSFSMRFDGPNPNTISTPRHTVSGTTLTVTFPRSDEAPAEANPEAEEVPVAVLKRRRVLVVDDNQQTRFLMERLLHAHFDTDTAASTEETYQLTQAEAYDAVLLDINLGAKASGEEVMQRLREDPHYATVPIVAFTAYALPGDRERFIHQGFDGYLSKPFTRKQLTALMHEMLPDATASPDPDEVTGSLLLGPYPPRQTGQRSMPRSTETLPERQPLSAAQDD